MTDSPKLPPMSAMLAQARDIARESAEQDRAGIPLLEAQLVESVRNNETSALAEPVSQRELDQLVDTVQRHHLTSRDLSALHQRLGGMAGLTPPQVGAAKGAVARVHNLLLMTERATREVGARAKLLVGEERVNRERSFMTPKSDAVELVATLRGPKGDAQQQLEWNRRAEAALARAEDDPDKLPE